MTDVDKLRAAALVDQALTQGSQDDALIARRPPQNALSTAAVEKWIDEAADRIAAWEQVWDNVRLDIPNLRQNNKPLAVAASYELLKQRATKAEAERDALKLRVNRLIGLCKSYSGALLDSDYPPAERDKLDALVGDIEKPPSAKENADG